MKSLCETTPKKGPRVWFCGLVLALLLPALVTAPAIAQTTQEIPQQKSATSQPEAPLPRGKKLILKDGTFQLVREYEIQGERVRFYSVERSQWEEIPAAMVDWDGTHKAEGEEARRAQEAVEKVREAEKAELAAGIDVDASIEVAPHLFLPPGEGLYVVDSGAVLPLEQSEAQAKLNKGRLLAQVLVPVPVVPSRHTVFVPGKTAKFRINNAQPEFYMRTADGREPEIQLVRARINGNKRQIESIDTYFGQQSSQRKTISLERWKVARGVYRFTLSQSLEPGEYALVEIIPQQGMNLYVWDFGVDPSGASAGQSNRR